MQTFTPDDLTRIDDYRWLLRRRGPMRTDVQLFIDRALLRQVHQDASIAQAANVACLPGIVGRSLAMPDMHQGYGFPIGGVAAFDPEEGVVSPGGVGYDINCGVRLLRSNLQREEIADRMELLVNTLFAAVPTGVGSRQRVLRLNPATIRKVLAQGAAWAVANGFGRPRDLEHIEEGGCLGWTEPELLSERAIERGLAQLGTLGSGNHFVEVGYVETVYDTEAARAMGLAEGRVTVIIHTGSRGLGHQVASDFIRLLQAASRRYAITLPDRELCCAPISSPEGKQYLGAMAAAANFAFANRQLITSEVRDTFARIFGRGEDALGLDLVYDVCHNVAKFEEHQVEGGRHRLLVHRKGATRAFPPRHPGIPETYRHIGQPVLIPGDMGRYSYVLAGTDGAMSETFGSTCHGAGRQLSRHAAKKAARGHNVLAELEEAGVRVRGAGMGTVVEEIPEAYKDVADVVRVVHEAGIARRVARLRPLGVIKG